MDTLVRLGPSDPPAPYGPLGARFEYVVRRGYTALVGANNSGKSSLLEFVFQALYQNAEFGQEAVAIVLPDREYVEITAQPAGRTLATWNNEIWQVLHRSPISYGAPANSGPPRSELARLLLHRNFMRQMRYLEALLPRVGLDDVVLRGNQELTFDEVSVALQGSGLRSILPILAVATDYGLKALLIDEPELSLEPRLQKVLRDMLVETAEQLIPVVIVATHSHLFLNRAVTESTQVVSRGADGTEVHDVTSSRELIEVTFNLLGSSTEDLFFPRNYLIVEGSSDQEIVTKVLALLGVESSTIKVLSARGIDTVQTTIDSVVRALVPLVVNDSPYAGRVVALIDRPRETDEANVRRLERDLRDRLYQLDVETIEEYIPESIYARAGRSRADDLERLKAAHGDRHALAAIKREVSLAVAAGAIPRCCGWA